MAQTTKIGTKTAKKTRRGMSMVYAMATMGVMFGFGSLGVDWGRVQLAKTQARNAADAASRYAAMTLAANPAAVYAAAVKSASENKVDGTPLALQPADVQIGFWNTATRTFVVTSVGPNAVRVVAHRTSARGNAVPLMFAAAIGRKSCDVNAESISMVVPGTDVDQNVLATSNPFLSGMPAGTMASGTNPHNDPDYAGTAANPKASPNAANMTLVGGQALTFDSISGDARHDPGMSAYSPDGQADDVGHNNLTTSNAGSKSSVMYNEHGIADANIPINALVGVFLDDSRPDATPAPANLDFSSAASRDFNTLKPGLKQIFFIGDGLTSGGNVQQFIAPKGATRLYLATWDFYEWSNNSGKREVMIKRPTKVITVK